MHDARIKNSNKYIISIIGMGASGVSIFSNIVESIIKNNGLKPKLYLIEKSKKNGPGLAYSEQSKFNLLNTPAFNMGVGADVKLGFINWIKENENVWKKEFPNIHYYDEYTFFPRRLFGLYLEDVYNLTKEKAENAGIDVFVINEEAKKIRYIATSSLYSIELDSTKIETNAICLCLGGEKSNGYPEAKKTINYLHYPWDEEKIRSIPNEASVTVIGTRLSGVDAILNLFDSRERKIINCVSRSGVFPDVISKYIYTPCYYLSENMILKHFLNRKITLQRLLSLISLEFNKAENKKIDWSKLIQKPRSGIIKLRHDLIHSVQIRPWQATLYSTNNLLNYIWSKMVKHDRDVLLSKYFDIFLIYRAVMPRCSAKKIYNLIRTRKLLVHSNVSSIGYNEEKSKYFFKFYNSEKTLSSQYVVDATGPVNNVNRSNQKIIHGLINDKYALVNSSGGFILDPLTMKLLNGKNINNLYVLGNFAKGVHFITNLIEDIVAQSKLVSTEILNNIK